MKYIMTILFFTILFLFHGVVNGAPNITGVTGSVTNNQAITILGSSFGSKSPAAPLAWNNFESCTTDANMLTCGFDDEGSDGSAAYIRADRAYGVGSKSAKMVYLANASLFPQIGNNTGGVLEVYVTFNSYFVRTSGTGSVDPIFKWCRGGSFPSYSGVPRFYDTVRLNPNLTQSGSDRGYVTATGTTWSQGVSSGVVGGKWDRIEYYYALSNPAGTATGAYQQWVNFGRNVNLTNHITRLTSENNKLIDYVMSPFDGLDSPGANAYAFWIDNYYLDNTRARIEICDTNTWSTRTHCEIQIPFAWSATSITATVNRGSFGASGNAFLYVVDSTGVANGTGYPITFGSAGETVPSPPTGLSVIEN